MRWRQPFARPAPEMSEYRVQFEVFEGPLDLLLHLVKKQEVDIYQVNLLRIATEWPMPVCVLALLGQSMLEGLLALALFAPAVTSTPGAT